MQRVDATRSGHRPDAGVPKTAIRTIVCEYGYSVYRVVRDQVRTIAGPLYTFDSRDDLSQTTDRPPVTATMGQDAVNRRVDCDTNNPDRAPDRETAEDTLSGLIAAQDSGEWVLPV
jgi:hypothetical protein